MPLLGTKYLWVDPDVSTHSSLAFVPKGDVDAWVAGFPCQPFSGLGEGLGESDARHVSEDEVDKICFHSQPKIFVIENVTRYQFFLKPKSK